MRAKLKQALTILLGMYASSALFAATTESLQAYAAEPQWRALLVPTEKIQTRTDRSKPDARGQFAPARRQKLMFRRAQCEETEADSFLIQVAQDLSRLGTRRIEHARWRMAPCQIQSRHRGRQRSGGIRKRLGSAADQRHRHPSLCGQPAQG